MYCANNPLKIMDPTGLESTDPNSDSGAIENETENEYEFLDEYKEHKDYELIKELYIHYQIFKLPEKAQEKFVELLMGSTADTYEPCTGFIVSSFKTTHDIDIIAEINKMEGTNMVEKAKNYADKTGKITIIEGGAEAQALANEAEDIGIIGHYFYKANTYRFIHYGKVAPSAISYDELGKPLKYKTKRAVLILEDAGDPNTPVNRWGPLVANKGAANGMVAFSWAFNNVQSGFDIADKTIRGGIIFFRIVPAEELKTVTVNKTRSEYYHHTRSGYIIRPEKK